MGGQFGGRAPKGKGFAVGPGPDATFTNCRAASRVVRFKGVGAASARLKSGDADDEIALRFRTAGIALSGILGAAMSTRASGV